MTARLNFDDLTKVSYAERQLVVVLADNVVTEARRAETAANATNKPVDWKDLAIGVGRMVTGSLLTTIIDEALAAWATARQNGLNILQIKRTEAASLVFPPGHPRDGVLYVGHPGISNVYFTVASFHRVAFEHKFAEAIELLMNLGASEIKVEHLRGWSREFAANLSVPLGPAETTATAGSKSTDKTSLLYEASLEGNTKPVLPEKLVWYPHESTWQSIAKGRLSFGLKQFSLTVSYEDDFGINAGLKVSAQKSGLELGGKFEDHVATTWKLYGSFK